MSPASFTPEQDLHFVLCDFGRSGWAYVEADPSQADASTVVRNLLEGQYTRPVRVLALNVEEGWVRDVSRVIAAKVQDVARHNGQGVTRGTRDFIEATATLPISNRCCPFGSEHALTTHKLLHVGGGRPRKARNRLPYGGELFGSRDVAACPPAASRLHWPPSPMPRRASADRPRLGA